jgi:hypothetical protein
MANTYEACACTGRCPDTGMTLTELLAAARDARMDITRRKRGIEVSWGGGGNDEICRQLIRHEDRILRLMTARRQKRIMGLTP